jgi:hypothetical protein
MLVALAGVVLLMWIDGRHPDRPVTYPDIPSDSCEVCQIRTSTPVHQCRVCNEGEPHDHFDTVEGSR